MKIFLFVIHAAQSAIMSERFMILTVENTCKWLAPFFTAYIPHAVYFSTTDTREIGEIAAVIYCTYSYQIKIFRARVRTRVYIFAFTISREIFTQLAIYWLTARLDLDARVSAVHWRVDRIFAKLETKWIKTTALCSDRFPLRRFCCDFARKGGSASGMP